MRPALRQVGLIALVQVLVMAVWFSASAVVPALTDQWSISSGQASLLTITVQIGFGVGAIASAILNLADRIETRRLMTICALFAATTTAAFALLADGLAIGIALRLLTGVALAGVYPPGLKLITTWVRGRRGLALGAMVAALTLGSGSPHLVAAVPDLPWRAVMGAAAGSALLGALLLMTVVREGPNQVATAPFEPRYLLRMLHERSPRLINLGYYGHMWELYAVWTWLPAFTAASLAHWSGHPASATGTEVIAFAAIGCAGAVGAALAGALADHRGRLRVARDALLVSGTCSALSPLVFGTHPAIVGVFLLLLGVTVIADSAQYSAALTEVADPRYLGTALTIQTAVGFLITVVSIRLVPVVVDHTGWRWALLPLAAGPLVGVIATSAAMRTDRADRGAIR